MILCQIIVFRMVNENVLTCLFETISDSIKKTWNFSDLPQERIVCKRDNCRKEYDETHTWTCRFEARARLISQLLVYTSVL